MNVSYYLMSIKKGRLWKRTFIKNYKNWKRNQSIKN